MKQLLLISRYKLAETKLCAIKEVTSRFCAFISVVKCILTIAAAEGWGLNVTSTR